VTPTFDERAEWFDHHYEATRGRVRAALVLERLAATLPPPLAAVLDVGGGSGVIAVPLAERGYDVTVLDPSPAMLELARGHARDAGADLRLVEGGVEGLEELAPGPFEAICCHAVLMYLDDPAAHLVAMRHVAHSGATLSLLEKNRLALAMRPGLRGDYAEALRVLDDPVASGNLGIPNRSRSVDEWSDMLSATGWRLDSWAGIRLFSDLAPDALPDDEYDRLLTLERIAGAREPYRSLARLVHLSATAI
jgi:ubiquinone/menaquinone biosynthesis C-methylase UbiE